MTMVTKMIEIYNYCAGRGDCIRIRFTGISGNIRNILIDSGTTQFGPRLSSICDEVKKHQEMIDVMIITHVDSDHLGGLLWNLRIGKVLPITEVWMNHGKRSEGDVSLSVRQRDEVYSRLLKTEIPVNSAVAGNTRTVDGMMFQVLWPDFSAIVNAKRINSVQLSRHSDWGYSIQELMDMPIKSIDTSPSNRASIVVKVQYESKSFLFTGDAWAEDLSEVVTDDHFDFMKLPHHGSIRNFPEELLGKVECQNYMICTDGVNHPDKQTIAKLISGRKEICILGSVNWWERKFFKEEDVEFQKRIHFLEGERSTW